MVPFSVFAKRIGTSGPEFKQGRFVWERYATATTPRLPTWTPESQDRIHIPWPEPEKPNVPKRMSFYLLPFLLCLYHCYAKRLYP